MVEASCHKFHTKPVQTHIRNAQRVSRREPMSRTALPETIGVVDHIDQVPNGVFLHEFEKVLLALCDHTYTCGYCINWVGTNQGHANVEIHVVKEELLNGLLVGHVVPRHSASS